MSSIIAKPLNLRWHQHDAYIISLMAVQGDIPPALIPSLKKIGLWPQSDSVVTMRAPRNWKSCWDSVYSALSDMHLLDKFDAAVMPDQDDSMEMTEFRPIAMVHNIAQSLWLGEALLENRVVCYLQTVVEPDDHVFGYESFARVRAHDGSIISGSSVIAASRALGIEYAIDRQLHVQALQTFVRSAFGGFLFVNLFPGFIHRPEVYLEGLGETAQKLGISPKHIVLDLTRAESPHDISHLKNVCDYARSQGMSVALDDIESLSGARKLVPEIRPDFIKLDSSLTRKVESQGPRETIRLITTLAHEYGTKVIAEGVETKDVHSQLLPLGVDLFQGYLFSEPLPVDAALSRAIG